jgi:hypothetical protein
MKFEWEKLLLNKDTFTGQNISFLLVFYYNIDKIKYAAATTSS